MNIFEILASEKWVGVSRMVDIAKGLHEIPQTRQEMSTQKQRIKTWQ